MFTAWIGCGNEESQSRGASADSGTEADGSGADGGTAGGDDDKCEVVATTPVGWTETTPLGTLEVAFSNMDGTCEAPLVWDGTDWGGTLVVAPEKGESIVTATVVIDKASGRVIERKPTSSGGVVDCPTSLEIDASVTLETPDGWLTRQQPITLQAFDDSGARFIDFGLSQEELGDWVSVTTADPNATVSMSIRMMPLSLACVGEVALMHEIVHDDSTEVLAQSRFASWSDTGCMTGEVGVNLAEPFHGVDLLAAVGEAFDSATLDGTWEGGGATTMSLSASVTALDICGEVLSYEEVVVIPVEIGADTADGRLHGLKGQGTVRASFSDQTLTQLELWVSKDVNCATTEDVLPYTTADCADVQGITMQLGIGRQYTPGGQGGGQLEVYVFERNSAAPPGAADRVDRLQLTY